MIDRKIRIGMVGGGKDAFIGGVHRIALRLDGHYELLAGSFSSNFDKIGSFIITPLWSHKATYFD